MSGLPAYAEELKRLINEPRSRNYPDTDVANHVWRHLDRILRDAEIAEAAREWFVANQDPAKDFVLAENDLIALIAKETP